MNDIDPALAHLYGDIDDDLDDVRPNRTTTLNELLTEGPEDEDVSDDDVAELALLVKARQDAGTSSDEFLAELGLGEFDGDVFDLNRVGLRVTRRLAEWEGLIPENAPGLR